MPWQSISNSPPSLSLTTLTLSITNHLTVISRSFASPLLGAPWAQQFTQYDIMCETMLATSFQFNLNWQQLINIYNMQSIITERKREREKREAELENRINIQNNANFACHCCCCCNCKRETRRLRKVSQREDAVYLIDAPHCFAPEQHWAAKPQTTASALGLWLPPSPPLLLPPSSLPSLTLFQVWQTVVTV